ncbi:MAG: hypothetical protein ACRD17_02190, partial [Terriglobales bacterium]
MSPEEVPPAAPPAPADAAATLDPPPALRRNILVLGLSALFNDIASEMAYWVLPYFLTQLGAGPGWL